MFCFLHDIGHAQLQRICSHVDENLDSIKPRGHGNKAKLPHNTTEFQEIEHIRDFILNTGRVRGMPLPGRLPGLRETEAYYLPADETQIEVYKQYKVAAEGENRTPVKYSTYSMVDSSSSPQALQSEGLSAARQQYLYQHISPLCSSKLAASITCPRPDA